MMIALRKIFTQVLPAHGLQKKDNRPVSELAVDPNLFEKSI